MRYHETVGVSRARSPRWLALFGGGTAGNEQLTAITGVVLIGLLAVLGDSLWLRKRNVGPNVKAAFLPAPLRTPTDAGSGSIPNPPFKCRVSGQDDRPKWS